MTDVRIPANVLAVVGRHFAPKPPPQPLADWLTERTGEHLWSKQVEIAESVRVNRKTAVQAGHGPGKTMVASRIICQFIDDHKPGEAFVVTTAPSWSQVKSILWREIGKAHRRAKLPGKPNLDCEWSIDGQLVAIGRKPADHDEEGFQGIHARYVLVVIDEACGVPPALWTAAETLLTNADARILAIGNPDNPNSEFAKVCEGSPSNESGPSDLGWHVITISTFDTPNFTGEVVPDELRELLPSQVWLDDVTKKWGTGSPLYMAKVLGQFPDDSTDGVIPNSWVAKCRTVQFDSPDDGVREGGLDPARDGDDEAVMWVRVGRKAVTKYAWPYTPDPKALAELALSVIQDHQLESVKIDADGLGWGISGILDVFKDEGRHTAMSVPVFGSARASDPEHFKNTRAEIWWAARERSRLEEWDLSELVDDDVAELVEVRYFVNPQGLIQIEKKEDLKKRLGRSPDSADALLLAFHEAFSIGESFVGAVAAYQL